jgi:hypothetical protein
MSYLLYTSQFPPSLTVWERNPLVSTRLTQSESKPRYRRQYTTDIHTRNWSKRIPSNPRFNPPTTYYQIFSFKSRGVNRRRHFTTNRAKTRSTYTRVRVRKSKRHRLLRVNQPEIRWIPRSRPVCYEVRCNKSDPRSETPTMAPGGGSNPHRIEGSLDSLELAIDDSRLDQTFLAFRAFALEMQW